MAKLSKTQQELFDAISSGVRVIYSPYMGRFNPKAYYYRADTYKRVTAAVTALIEKDVVEKIKRDARGHEIGIKAQEPK